MTKDTETIKEYIERIKDTPEEGSLYIVTFTRKNDNGHMEKRYVGANGGLTYNQAVVIRDYITQNAPWLLPSIDVQPAENELFKILGLY